MSNLNVPLKPFYLSRKTIEIPNIGIQNLVNLIDEFLSNTTKIKWNKIENKFEYFILYFPIENFEIIPNNKSHSLKYFSAIYSAEKALKLFPHNIPMYHDNYDYPDSSPSLSYWFKAKLQIYYDSDKDCYLLEPTHLSGETFSFYKFLKKIKKIFNKKTFLWLMRKNYISVVEDMQPKTWDHITKYLLDDIICKEICSYY
jgi:hypothetical protein